MDSKVFVIFAARGHNLSKRLVNNVLLDEHNTEYASG